MALGSLLDAGADESEVVAMLDRLPLDGWRLLVEPVLRGGIACTRAIVQVDDATSDVPRGRTYADVVSAVHEATLPTRVAQRALATFEALAQVEGLLHRTDPQQVHFHEVGGHDALIDIVGTAAALEVLGVDTVTVSPIALGTGTVRAAHGTLPNPSPAVLRLLEGFATYGRPVPLELTTPTGAALMRALVSPPSDSGHGPMPAMTVRASGYGAGAAELDTLPNCTQVVLGTPVGLRTGPGQPVTVLEANLDDATGEQLAAAIVSLMDRGALDAWVTPVVMKKGRPGHTVHALCDPASAELLADVMRRTTGSFGVRALGGERWPESRRVDQVLVEGEPVRVKLGLSRVKAEPEDVARVAAATGLGVQEVAARAEALWHIGERGEGWRRADRGDGGDSSGRGDGGDSSGRGDGGDQRRGT
jgi:uncharacterized protein (TIGR00299 family) protein